MTTKPEQVTEANYLAAVSGHATLIVLGLGKNSLDLDEVLELCIDSAVDSRWTKEPRRAHAMLRWTKNPDAVFGVGGSLSNECCLADVFHTAALYAMAYDILGLVQQFCTATGQQVREAQA